MRRSACLAALGLVLAGCSSKTSAPVVCDNSGVRLMAFASDRQVNAGHYQVWLYDFDGPGYHLLRNLGSASGIDSTPTISSDAQLVAFARTDTTDPSHVHILVYDRAGCGFAGVGGALDTGHEKDPAFTGNALRLAFARDTLAHWRIRLISANGALVPLGQLGQAQAYDDWRPAPNHDGSRIAFVSNRVTLQHPDGEPHVFVFDVAGDSLVTTPGLDSLGAPGRGLDPSLTPDGRWLFFSSDRPGGLGGFDIYRYDLTNRTLEHLPAMNSAQDDRYPSINQAGDVVAFQSLRTAGAGLYDLWLFTIGGASPNQPAGVPSAADDRHPALVFP